jgi:hypothetical protein
MKKTLFIAISVFASQAIHAAGITPATETCYDAKTGAVVSEKSRGLTTISPRDARDIEKYTGERIEPGTYLPTPSKRVENGKEVVCEITGVGAL